jgi:hypothetical protein
VADESRPTSVVLNPQQLKLYAEIHPELPLILTKAAIGVERRAFWFAMAQGAYGFIIAGSIVAGAVYLGMNNHGAVAASLLGAGAVSIVTGFQVSRLEGRLSARPRQNSRTSHGEHSPHSNPVHNIQTAIPSAEDLEQP